MARINTKAGLIAYVKTQLGYPLINIEVTDDQIGQIIDDTVQKFSEYAYGTLEAAVVVQLSGKNDYPMIDTMTNVLKSSAGAEVARLVKTFDSNGKLINTVVTYS